MASCVEAVCYAAVLLEALSHTRTVVRKCCKVDDASQWENWKFLYGMYYGLPQDACNKTMHTTRPQRQIQSAIHGGFYAALLPRRGPHYASHSVCPSVCPSVPLSLPSVTTFRHALASRMYFSARAEGRISYGHLDRTDSCFHRASTRTFQGICNYEKQEGSLPQTDRTSEFIVNLLKLSLHPLLITM